MGYENVAQTDTALTESGIWSRYRHQFPVTANLTYLNHAAVSPLSKPAADAMRWLATDAELYGSLHYDKWLAAYEALRVATSRLINADAREIALVKNTSEGIATIALGFPWHPGDRMVAFEEEFPANLYPWKRLENQGVSVQWLSIYDPLESIDSACKEARLLAISHVNYLSGHRVDLAALGEICRRHGTFFFVDAIQGLGAFPIDVRGANIQGLAADGHKWLTGPEGCGVLYVQQGWQDRVEPVEFGWTNVAGYADYASRDMTLRSDAGRYEPGTLNTIGICGLRAAIDFLLEVGIEGISASVLARADQLVQGACQKGYELLRPREAATSSGIVTLRKPDIDARLIIRRLRDNNVVAAPRQGFVRFSPHFYISPADIDRVIELLP